MIKLNSVHPFKKSVKTGELKIMNELSETAQLQMQSSFPHLSQLAEKTKKDVRVFQKGEDLVLVNIGGKTKTIRPTEVAKQYSESKLAQQKAGREVNPEDFTDIVLRKIHE